MKQTLYSVIALAGLASATGWINAPSYSCPSNTNNTCTDSQKTGFDWSSLTIGSFSEYEQFSFSGYTCASSFGGGKKRDLLSGRTFQDKCITGVASSDTSSCPKMSCGSSSPEGFSVSEIQISVEFDCDLEFHYAMPGGTTCKKTSSCSSSGSVVSNDQCGGATAVSVVYPSQTTGSGTAKSTCSIGVHSIGFDCSTASSTVSQSTYTKTTATSVSTTKASSTKTTPATTTSTPQSTTKGSTTLATTAATTAVTTPVSSSAIVYSNSTSSSSASSSEGVTGSASSSIVTSYTTIVTDVTTTSCPVTTTHVVSGTTSIQTLTTVSTIISTHVSTVCPKCSGGSSVTGTGVSIPVSSGTSVAASAGVTTTASEAPCPTVVPNCLNTWMWSCGCPDNATPDCYCPSADYVNSVYACFSAYANSTAEIAAAQQYFQGICAAHVSSNPAIITGASVVATSTAQGITAPASAQTPVTTITVDTTLTVPCTSGGTVISSSSTTTVISTQLTVPQVAFTTAAGTGSSSSIGLIAGTAPASVSATTTGGSSEAASAATGTGAYTPTTTLASSTVKGGTSSTASTVPFTAGSAKTSTAFSSMVFAALFAIFAL